MEREAIKKQVDQKEKSGKSSKNDETGNYSDEFEATPDVEVELVGPFAKGKHQDEPVQEFLRIQDGIMSNTKSKGQSRPMTEEEEELLMEDLEERDENIDDLEIHLDA